LPPSDPPRPSPFTAPLLAVENTFKTHAEVVAELQKDLQDKQTQLTMARAQTYVAKKLPDRKAPLVTS
jgi:hypothetical protein